MSMPAGRAPVIKAAILCDHAIREHQTGKWSIVGIWDRLFLGKEPTPQQPVMHPHLGLYFYLVDCSPGDMEWSIEFVRYGDVVESYLELRGHLVVREDMSPFEFAVNLQPVLIHRLGKHAFRLTVGGHYLGDKEFLVLKTPEAKHD